jgi:hypothetical protein
MGRDMAGWRFAVNSGVRQGASAKFKNILADKHLASEGNLKTVFLYFKKA